MRFLRPALAAAALATFSLAGSAFAAGPNVTQFADPTDDSMSATASGEITGVTFTTKGLGKGKAYVPKSLVVTMALGDVPGTNGTTQYYVGWTIEGCDYYMYMAPGAKTFASFGNADCGSEPDSTGNTGTSFGFSAVPVGKAMEFKVAIKDLPNKVKPGVELSGLNAYTDLVEPTGLIGTASLGLGALYDTAKTTKDFTLG